MLLESTLMVVVIVMMIMMMSSYHRIIVCRMRAYVLLASPQRIYTILENGGKKIPRNYSQPFCEYYKHVTRSERVEKDTGENYNILL
jgi:hypothetical protein